MTAPEERNELISLISEATLAGARQAHTCNILGLSARTVQRWQRGDPDAVDGRSLRHHEPRHKLSADERAELLAVANPPEFGHLPPSQIVPRLADQQRYIASESTFYRVLKAGKQTRPPAQRTAGPRSQKTPFGLRRRAEPVVFLGHHVSADDDPWTVFLSVPVSGCSQSQDRRLAGLGGGKQRAGQRSPPGPLRTRSDTAS